MASSALSKSSVLRIYQEVIDDVILGVRELFLEDGVDEQLLQELKSTWETKLMASKAVQHEQEEKMAKKDLSSNGIPKQVVPQAPQQVVQQHIQVPATEVKMVPIQITLPPQPGSDGTQRVLTIHVPASALQGNQLQKVLTGPVITATMGLPANIASSLLQQHVNAAFGSQALQQPAPAAVVVKTLTQTDGAADEEEPRPGCSGTSNTAVQKGQKRLPKKMKKVAILKQTDGPNDTSDDDDEGSDDNDDDDDLDDEKDDDNEEIEDEGAEEEPLNSEDDVSDDDPTDLFDTDNIVVCQYDKIIRNRNRWKFYLKDGIMNLNGLDYVFQKANGDAEW